jgi:nitrite reductase/ring-hydroxylating ferredoxin subunit
MSGEQRIGAAADLPPGRVMGVGRHLGADSAAGSIDENGCLVCPWHRSAYDVATGRMVRGPQGTWAKVPGLDAGYRLLTRVPPLGRVAVTERGGELYLADSGRAQGAPCPQAAGREAYRDREQ